MVKSHTSVHIPNALNRPPTCKLIVILLPTFHGSKLELQMKVEGMKM
jgi:hypothetical protein